MLCFSVTYVFTSFTGGSFFFLVNLVGDCQIIMEIYEVAAGCCHWEWEESLTLFVGEETWSNESRVQGDHWNWQIWKLHGRIIIATGASGLLQLLRDMEREGISHPSHFLFTIKARKCWTVIFLKFRQELQQISTASGFPQWTEWYVSWAFPALSVPWKILNIVISSETTLMPGHTATGWGMLMCALRMVNVSLYCIAKIRQSCSADSFPLVLWGFWNISLFLVAIWSKTKHQPVVYIFAACFI